MNTFPTFSFVRALGEALASAVQWRVWLLWILALAIPTVLGVAPLQAILADLLDHLPDGALLAQGVSAAQGGDLMNGISDAGGFSTALAGAIVVALLLAPWLTGVAITAARAQRPPRFAELVQGGLHEYSRQFRLLLWAFVVYLVALGVFFAVSHWANERAEDMVLERSARLGTRLALAVGVLAFIAAHASLEAARAFLVVRPNDGGALRAWWRAVKLLARRPLAGFGLYLGVLLAGVLVSGLVAVIRIWIAPVGWGWVIVALVLTQLGVAAMAWGRVARLRALAHLAQDEALRRYR